MNECKELWSYLLLLITPTSLFRALLSLLFSSLISYTIPKKSIFSSPWQVLRPTSHRRLTTTQRPPLSRLLHQESSSSSFSIYLFFIFSGFFLLDWLDWFRAKKLHAYLLFVFYLSLPPFQSHCKIYKLQSYPMYIWYREPFMVQIKDFPEWSNMQIELRKDYTFLTLT